MKTTAAVPADLRFRNGRGARFVVGGRELRLPLCFQCFHLLSAVPDDSIAAHAQTKPGQSGAAGDAIHTGAGTSPALLKVFRGEVGRGDLGSCFGHRQTLANRFPPQPEFRSRYVSTSLHCRQCHRLYHSIVYRVKSLANACIPSGCSAPRSWKKSPRLGVMEFATTTTYMRRTI